MLHTKFLGNRSWFQIRILLKGFTVYVRVGHLGRVTKIMLINFHFFVHVPKSLDTKCG